MSPEEQYVASPKSPNHSLSKLLVRLLLFVIVVSAITFGIIALLNYIKPFSITGTLPNVNKLTTQTQIMDVDFSHPIASGSVSIASSPSIITKTVVSGNRLTLVFAKKTLLSTKQYTITIKSIRSTRNQQLTNQRIIFSPSFAPPQRLGEQALLTAGLSTDQLNRINSHIAEFLPWAQQMVVNQSGVNYYPVDPNNTDGLWAISFSMEIDDNSYNAIGYFYDSFHIQLKIFDPTTNQQLFAAGNPLTD